MIFGRKRRAAKPDPTPIEESGAEEPEVEPDPLEELDEWARIDVSAEREDGPFDYDEVDLDADDVERIDLGALILTGFPGMRLQLQADEATRIVNSVLVMDGEESALEVALFAAPKVTNVVADMREQLTAASRRAGGTVDLAEGPFGVELRRVMPVSGPDGKKRYHISRIWLSQGPRWLLRGVLMGRAAQHKGEDGPALKLFEFFGNVVARRGDEPLAVGDVVPLTIPTDQIRS